MSIFELTETSYVEAVWFVAWPGTDWMALVYRDDADAPWRCTYRFRYHAAGERDPFDNRDTKSVYHIRATNGDEDARVRLVSGCDQAAADLVVNEAGARFNKILVQGDADRYLELLAKQPWAHLKVLPPCSDAIQ